jgi:hypothetical protein
MNESNGKSTASSLWPLVAVLSDIATREPAASLDVEQTGSDAYQLPDPTPPGTSASPDTGEVQSPCLAEGGSGCPSAE